jgi:site-specific recombinase XerD
MASVSKDQRWPRCWYAHFTDALGRRRKKSTGLTSKSKALEMAHTLQRAANEARRGLLTEVRTRELLGEILASVTGETLRSFTVEAWFEHFAAQKAKSRASQTAARHRQMMREFVEFLGPRARLNIAAITSKDIADFRDHRLSLGLAPSTVNADIITVGAAFAAALKQGHISTNPIAVIEPLRDKAQRKAVFSPEQMSALVKAASGDMRTLVMIGFYTGIRIHDAANLRWRNVDLVSEIKTIRFVQGKTGRGVVVPLAEPLEDYLLSLPAPKSDEAPLCPNLAGRVTSPLSKEFRALMERARIEQRVIREPGKTGRTVFGLSFHSLRHSFSSLLANAGIDQGTRMELVGHTQADTHKIYTHRQLSTLRDAVSVLPRIV